MKVGDIVILDNDQFVKIVQPTEPECLIVEGYCWIARIRDDGLFEFVNKERLKPALNKMIL